MDSWGVRLTWFDCKGGLNLSNSVLVTELFSRKDKLISIIFDPLKNVDL